MGIYTLDQAQRDIAGLRYLVTALQNVALKNPNPAITNPSIAGATFTGTLTFPDGSTWGVSGLTLAGSLASPSFTGTVTFPDGTTWTSGGPSLHAPLALSQGGTGANYGSNAALLSGIGGAPLASPTFTGTVTFPDGSTWSSSGIVADTWHNVTYDTNWSNLSGYSHMQYRFTAFGTVQFTGAATHASITATLAINSSNPLASAYRPASIKKLASGNSPLAELNVEFRTDGVIYALANGSAAGTKAIVDKNITLVV